MLHIPTNSNTNPNPPYEMLLDIFANSPLILKYLKTTSCICKKNHKKSKLKKYFKTVYNVLSK